MGSIGVPQDMRGDLLLDTAVLAGLPDDPLDALGGELDGLSLDIIAVEAPDGRVFCQEVLL